MSGSARSRPIPIEPAWLDYNGHLNMAYYMVIFDRALDEAVVAAGLGPDYVARRGLSYMCLEAHVRYLREVVGKSTVVVTTRVLDVDEKRLHLACEMLEGREEVLAATSEWLFVHVDMASRRSAPWPDDVRAGLAAMKAAADHLPRPAHLGRAISFARRR
jgi:acyl-CoA thioester hydrolase